MAGLATAPRVGGGISLPTEAAGSRCNINSRPLNESAVCHNRLPGSFVPAQTQCSAPEKSLSSHGCIARCCGLPNSGARNTGQLKKRWFSWGRPGIPHQQESIQVARALADQYAMKSNRRYGYYQRNSTHLYQPCCGATLPTMQTLERCCCQLGVQPGESRAHTCISTIQAHTTPHIVTRSQSADTISQQKSCALQGRGCSSSGQQHHQHNIPAQPGEALPGRNTSIVPPAHKSVCCSACHDQRGPREATQTPSYLHMTSAGSRCPRHPGTVAMDGSTCMHSGQAGGGLGRCLNPTSVGARRNVELYVCPKHAAASQTHCSSVTLPREGPWRESSLAINPASCDSSHQHVGGLHCLAVEGLRQRLAMAEDKKQKRPARQACVSSTETPPSPPSSMISTQQRRCRFASSAEAVMKALNTSSTVPPDPPSGVIELGTSGPGTSVGRSCPHNRAGGKHPAPCSAEQQQQLEILRLQHELLAERQARQEQQLLQQQQELRRQQLLQQQQELQRQELLQQEQELRRQRWKVKQARQRAAAEAVNKTRFVESEVDSDYTSGENEVDTQEELSFDERGLDESRAVSLHKSTDVSCADICDSDDLDQTNCCDVYSESSPDFESQGYGLPCDENEECTSPENCKMPCKASRRVRWFRGLKTPH